LKVLGETDMAEAQEVMQDLIATHRTRTCFVHIVGRGRNLFGDGSLLQPSTYDVCWKAGVSAGEALAPFRNQLGVDKAAGVLTLLPWTFTLLQYMIE
jgi:hypothetical protein